MFPQLRRQLLILFLIGLVGLSLILITTGDVTIPGSDQGFAPAQPIAFSHRLHSGDLQVPCQYCHSSADRSRHAGIPAAAVCMNCHRSVTSGWDQVLLEETQAAAEGRPIRPLISPELQKLYDAVGFDPLEMKPVPGQGRQLEWIRVHRLPDFVFFDHRSHLTAGVRCQECHGPVETMERVSQQMTLSMGWCVNCHRDVRNGKMPALAGREPSTDCGVCHY